jgi:hypothetical protein
MASKALPYDETTSANWLKIVDSWPWQQIGPSKWKKVGSCPRCKHEMYGVFYPRVVLFSDEAGEESSGTPQEVYIECNCSAPHTGRPEDETGCGPDGFFRAPTPTEGGGDVNS